MTTSAKKRPCQFCRQSRWVMTIMVLVIMAGVAVMNLSAG